MAVDTAPFTWGGSGERLTPETVKRQREIAALLIKQGTDGSPVKHWTEGANRVAAALLGGYESRLLDQSERAGLASASAQNAAIPSIFGGTPGASAPVIAPAPTSSVAPVQMDGGAPTMAPAAPSSVPAPAGGAVVGDVGATAAGGRQDVNTLKAALAPMESGGRYDIKGPYNAKMGTPLGKYQIMSANLPEWSRAALGREVTPDEFLKNPELQEQIAGHRMGSIIDRYGNLKDAASVWHSGRPLAVASAAGARDVNMSTADYVAKTVGRLPGGGALPAQKVAGVFDTGSVPNTNEGVPLEYRGQSPQSVVAAAPPIASPARSAGLPTPAETAAMVRDGILPQDSNPAFIQEQWNTQPVYRQNIEAWRQKQGQQPLATTPVTAGPVQLASSGNSDAPMPGAARIAAALTTPDSAAASGMGAGDYLSKRAQEKDTPPAPAPQRIAQALVPQTRPYQVTDEAGRAAEQVLTNPWSSEDQKDRAKRIIQMGQAERAAGQWFERTTANGGREIVNNKTGEIKSVEPGRDPLDTESKKLDIASKKQSLGKRERVEMEIGGVKRIMEKQDDGSWAEPRMVLNANTPAAPPKPDEISGLRKEIQQLPSYKNMAQAAPIYQSMFNTAGTNTKASDLNLIYGLGKIMDPGSVVREGELVMAQNAASMQERLNGLVRQLEGGSALTPKLREQLMAEAHGRMQSYQQQFGQDSSMYGGIVERNRMNAADVIPHFGEFKVWTQPSKLDKVDKMGAGVPPSPSQLGVTPPGSKSSAQPSIGDLLKKYGGSR